MNVRAGDTMGSIFYGVEFEVCTKPLTGDALRLFYFFPTKDSALLEFLLEGEHSDKANILHNSGVS